MQFVPLTEELWSRTSGSHSVVNEDRMLVAFPGDCQVERILILNYTVLHSQ